MKKLATILALIAIVSITLGVPALPISGQGQSNLTACSEFAFSTEEDFVTQGPTPPDGNPVISDGDLLGPGCVVCARNRELLYGFDISQNIDLGLDAVDVLDVQRQMVVFSTELDSPNTGQFTAGDLIITSTGGRGVIPNIALMHRFGIRYDIGLDGLQFIGSIQQIIAFVEEAIRIPRGNWVQNPALLSDMLRRRSIDIWFSTEGTGPASAAAPQVFDGDLLSARDGTIVVSNGGLFPASVPAGIPNNGVDFGLDAVATDRAGNLQLLLFSTEILFSGTPGFTDGDVLQLGNGVVKTNEDLVGCFEPKARFLGLDALSISVERPACGAAIIRVGGMPAGQIGATTGLANGLSSTTPPFEAHDSPFGGWVEILGLMPSCTECSHFKVEYGLWPNPTTPPSTWLPLTDPFQEWRFIWPGLFVLVNRVPDANGWLSILCNSTMGGLYYPWNTSGKNGKYSIRLTIRETGGTEHVSMPVVVMLDNTAPTASLTLDTVPICGDVTIGDVVTGKITGTDLHFYSYRLRYESSLASGDILPVRKYTSVSDTGDTNVAFSWNTTGLPACGYRIILEVWDRTIVNNQRIWGEPGFGWRTPLQIYFCLEAAQ